MLWSRLIRIASIFLVLSLPALAQPTTLTGTVTYRERTALAPDARLQVTLVRLPAATPVAGASAAIPAKGQVPIAFSLTLHDGVASDGGNYGLLAHIESDGRVIFNNDQPTPVDLTLAQQIAILVRPARAPAADLADTVPVAPEGLLDVVWKVTSIGGRPVSGPRPLTLTIAADLGAGGNAGCNSFFTEATIDGAALAFGPAAATRMACAAEIMAQEANYLAALEATAGYQLDATSLRLLDPAGIPLIGLVHDKE